MSATHRESVPITDEVGAFVSAAQQPGTPEHEILHAIGAHSGSLSRAKALAVLVDLGLRTATERVAELGYAALAAAQDEEDAAFHRAVRSRGGRRTSEAEA